VPDEVRGEGAGQDVAADPVFGPVPDRAEVEVVGFHGSEVAFDAGLNRSGVSGDLVV
jgi:hypothetical protein